MQRELPLERRLAVGLADSKPVSVALSILCAAVYLGGLLGAAGFDLVSYTIPNRIVAVVAAAAGLALILAAPDSGLVLRHAAVAFAVLVVGALLFFARVWGAGDAKLMAAAALATGTPGLPLLVFWTAMAGGVMAAAVLAVQRLPFFKRLALQLGCRAVSGASGNIPYGIAIAAGAIAAFLGHGTVLTLHFLTY